MIYVVCISPEKREHVSRCFVINLEPRANRGPAGMGNSSYSCFLCLLFLLERFFGSMSAYECFSFAFSLLFVKSGCKGMCNNMHYAGVGIRLSNNAHGGCNNHI
jgi:hypothetical protein